MVGRDGRDRDPDDWFDEVGPAVLDPERPAEPEGRHDEAPETDDWLKSGDAQSVRGSRIDLGRVLSDRRVAIGVGVLALVCLVIGLAVGGVFGGATRAQRPPTTLTTATLPAAPASTQATTNPIPAPATKLQPGDSGKQVRALQRALAHLGYSPGRLDGRYGAATQSAVANFRRSVRLAPDGILGANTLRALDNALKRP